MKILAISRMLPFPLDEGEKLRTFHLHAQLSKHHEINLLVLNHFKKQLPVPQGLREVYREIYQFPHSRSFLKKGCDLLESLIEGIPYGVKANTSPEIRSKIYEIVKSSQFDLLLLQSLAVADNITNISLPCSIVLDAHNWESRVARNISRLESNPLRRCYYRAQSQYIHTFERAISTSVSGIIAVSDREHRYFSRFGPTVVVPNGVALNPPKGEEREPAVLFTGQLKYPPNLDAAEYLLKEIWPRIETIVPDSKLLIIARNPPERLRALATSQVEFLPHVDDINSYFHRCKVLIAPLRAGGGSRLKILQAMAAKLPVVSTKVGAEGIDAVDGEHLLIAETSEELARKVIAVMTGGNVSTQLAEAAFSLVAAKYEWSMIAEPINEFFEKLDRRQ